MWSRVVLALTLLASPAIADKKFAVATGYARTTRGMPPPHGKKTMKFLTSAPWAPIIAKSKDKTLVAPPKLRLVSAARDDEAKDGERTIVVKRVAKQRGATIVEIEHEVFGLAPCKDKKLTACLMPRPDLSFPNDDYAKAP